MASSGKKKTTMAKLQRERRLQEKRLDKKARKEARKLAAVHGPGSGAEGATGRFDEAWEEASDQPETEPALQPLSGD